MEKYITDERTGLKYELIGDYYLVADDDEPEECPIRIWWQRHLRYLKQHRRTTCAELLASGKSDDYLADINELADDMFRRLATDLPPKTELLKRLKQKIRCFGYSVLTQYGKQRQRMSIGKSYTFED